MVQQAFAAEQDAQNASSHAVADAAEAQAAIANLRIDTVEAERLRYPPYVTINATTERTNEMRNLVSRLKTLLAQAKMSARIAAQYAQASQDAEEEVVQNRVEAQDAAQDANSFDIPVSDRWNAAETARQHAVTANMTRDTAWADAGRAKEQEALTVQYLHETDQILAMTPPDPYWAGALPSTTSPAPPTTTELAATSPAPPTTT